VYAGASNVMQVNAPECQKHRKDCLHMGVDARRWNCTEVTGHEVKLVQEDGNECE